MDKAELYNHKAMKAGNITPEHVTQLVRHWQHSFDLTVDGMLGPDTWASVVGNRLGTIAALRALELAQAELGRGEVIANNQSAYIDKLRRTDGTRGRVVGVKGAWCAAAVCSWIMRALKDVGGLHHIPFEPSRGARRLGKNMAEENYTLEAPEPGAVGIYSRGPLKGWQGHAVLFESYDPDKDSAVAIEGNKGKFPAVVKRVAYPDGSWRKRLLGIYSIG